MDQWFEPAFKKLDESLVTEKRTLVHCRAGSFRSPTLLIAYLINRYNVTAEQALDFLRSKRPTANTKYLKQLNAYAKALASKKAGV